MIRTPFFVAVILSVSAGIRIYRIRHTPSSVLLSPSTVSLSSVLCLSVSLSLCLSLFPSNFPTLCIAISLYLSLSLCFSLSLSLPAPPFFLILPVIPAAYAAVSSSVL